MASKGHFISKVDFPIYSLAWTDDREFVVCGGGGAGRSGVKNSISLYEVDAVKQKCERRAELELSRKEDAPSTIAVHKERKELVAGINSEEDSVKSGTNDNLRVFSYTDKEITASKATSTMSSTDPEVYQKITTFSKDESLLAIGSSVGQLSLRSYPTLERILPDFDFGSDEMFDADFNEDGSLVLGASAQRICIWNTSKGKGAVDSEKTDAVGQDEDGSSPIEPLQIIERPVLEHSLKCTFRNARFGRQGTSNRLFTVVNATSQAAAGGGGSRKARRNIEKKAFISVWDTDSWSLIKTRTVSRKPVTSFDVSPDGRLLAIGGADLSVSIFDAETVRPLLSVLAAHDFPSTTLRFSPASDLLISGSADNSLRVILADQALHPSRHKGITTALIALLVLLIAVLLQIYAGDEIMAVARKHLHV